MSQEAMIFQLFRAAFETNGGPPTINLGHVTNNYGAQYLLDSNQTSIIQDINRIQTQPSSQSTSNQENQATDAQEIPEWMKRFFELEAKQAVLEAKQGLMEDKQGLMETKQGLIEDKQGLMEAKQGLMEDKQGLMDDRQGVLENKQERELRAIHERIDGVAATNFLTEDLASASKTRVDQIESLLAISDIAEPFLSVQVDEGSDNSSYSNDSYEADSQVLGASGYDDSGSPNMTCRVCAQAIPTYMGLPCGHLVFCDACKSRETKTAEHVGSYGPCGQCGSSITDTQHSQQLYDIVISDHTR